MSVMTVLEYFNLVLHLTKAKRFQSNELCKEYFALEQVPPAPGTIKNTDLKIATTFCNIRYNFLTTINLLHHCHIMAIAGVDTYMEPLTNPSMFRSDK
jgi:hypothetical protein